jgi:glycosyltransferase involved in cell wall biosynthesis
MSHKIINAAKTAVDAFIFDHFTRPHTIPRASVIFSRFFWEDPFWQNIGSGRMQKEAYECLNALGYVTSFAGQEDRWYPKRIWNADLIVALAPAFLKLPKKIPGTTFLYTCNTHVTIKNRRLAEAAKTWNLPQDAPADPLIFLPAYEKADYLLIAENDEGISNFTSLGISKDRICRYNNAIDSDIWIQNPQKRDKFTFVCWSSELGLRKGLPVLVNSWKKWYNCQDAELLIVGMPTRSTDLLFGGQREGLVSPGLRIHLATFPTWHKPLIELIGSSHVAVYPTLEDAQPSCLLEMTSCGLPVITTRESGVDFDLEFCYYITTNDVDSLAEGFEYWFQKRDNTKRAGNLARDYILKHHTWDVFRKRFSAIMCEIMK